MFFSTRVLLLSLTHPFSNGCSKDLCNLAKYAVRGSMSAGLTAISYPLSLLYHSFLLSFSLLYCCLSHLFSFSRPSTAPASPSSRRNSQSAQCPVPTSLFDTLSQSSQSCSRPQTSSANGQSFAAANGVVPESNLSFPELELHNGVFRPIMDAIPVMANIVCYPSLFFCSEQQRQSAFAAKVAEMG